MDTAVDQVGRQNDGDMSLAVAARAEQEKVVRPLQSGQQRFVVQLQTLLI